ncbi:uncharacterized protein TNCV_4703271 [Trichonephila clavipes]|nr:uncharacterized protein TNCV_4703271 [Trichonephila clavipes]
MQPTFTQPQRLNERRGQKSEIIAKIRLWFGSTSVLSRASKMTIGIINAHLRRYSNLALRDFQISSINLFLFLITETQAVLVPEPDEIGNVIQEIVDLARQINLEVNSDDVQELLDSHNQELTMDELIEMHEQDIEELKSLYPVSSKDRMTLWN